MAAAGTTDTGVSTSAVDRRVSYFQKLETIRGSIVALDPSTADQTETPTHYRQDGPADLRLVLIGRSGEGKSATGNLILGSKSFKSTVNAQGVTAKCVMKRCNFNDKKVMVVDTPGLFDAERPNTEIRDEILKFTAITAPGPHAFLLTVGVNRQTPEVGKTYEYIQEILGARAHQNTIIVFTRKDDLDYHDLTVEMYLEKPPKNLKSLLKAVGNRYCAVNNRVKLTSSDRSDQVNELLKVVEDMLKENHGKIYSTWVLTAADNALSSYTWSKDEQMLQSGVRRATHIQRAIHDRAKELGELKAKGAVNATLKQKREELSLLIRDGNKKLKGVEAECQEKLEDHRHELQEDIAEDNVSVSKPWFISTLMKSAHKAFVNLFSS